MFYTLSEEQLRSICRNNIETLEKWARLLIDKELRKVYGTNYFQAMSENGVPIIKKDIRDKAKK